MTKRKVLDRDMFLQAGANLKRELVTIEGFGSVYVRELGGKSLLVYNEKIEDLQKINPEITPASSVELMALLVSLTACDENGRLLFTAEDVAVLSDNSINVLMTLSQAALRISGVPMNAIEEVAANLGNALPDSSTSD